MSLSTSAWLQALGRRELRPGEWTLEVIEDLCRALGDPHLAVRTLHVAGTRGKGSTCALIESALRASGRRTGLTTSPHLVSPCERIRLDGTPIPEARLLRLAERVRQAGAEDRLAGYFEVMTAAAFLAFAEEGVDVAIVETGLGGRVDATNVVRPLVAVITHLGLDHADRLGGTRESIASEKAGILKPSARGVLAPNDPRAMAVVARRAADVGASLRLVGEADLARAPATSLPGVTQRENAAVALVALEELALADASLACTPSAVAEGFASTRWRARLERIPAAIGGADLLLDVAHDLDGTRALVDHLSGRRPDVVIFSCLADKDLDGMAAELRRCAGEATLVLVPELDSPRARPAGAVAGRLREAGLRARAHDSVESALAEAAGVASPGDLVVAFGSFHVAGRVLELVAAP